MTWNGRHSLIASAILAGVGLGALAASPAAQEPASAGSHEEIFKQRILPILRSPKPASCAECHLGGVDLKDYLDPDPVKTFASLRAAGLVDPEKPEASKLLCLIRMKPEKASPIAQEMREKEYEAFMSWLLAAAKDPAVAAAEPKGKVLGPSAPDPVIRHSRKDRLLSSFEDNIWSERMRCWHCHGPEDPPNPKQAEKKREWIEKFGRDRLVWLKATPEETLDSLLAGKLLDLDKPDRSLILLKSTTQVEHQGGKKITIGDRGWRQFQRFIDDVRNIVKEKYRKESDLPGILRTANWIRVTGMGAGKPVQMQIELHRWVDGRWSKEPFAQGLSFVVQGFWVGPMEMLVAHESKEYADLNASRRLPPGKYQIRFYVDDRGLLQRQPLHDFGPADLTAIAEIDVRDWPADERDDTVLPKDRRAYAVAWPGEKRK